MTFSLPKKSLMTFLEGHSKAGQNFDPDYFPRPDLNYYIEFMNFQQRMNIFVHPNVTAGAISIDRGRLTDHGKEHIQKVIRQCGALINGSRFEITPYETYLLLMAAHVHDIGNILGRKNHEKNARRIIEACSLKPNDTSEYRAILQIAGAHGGSVGNDKDTIGRLPRTSLIMGQDVRFQQLAAVLRFADELSDDVTRADLTSLSTGTLPASAEIYHRYARGLHSVAVSHDSQQVSLEFQFEPIELLNTYGKGSAKTCLLHEVLRRTYKVFTEQQYVSQFLMPDIISRRVSVKIRIDDGGDIIDEIGYRISLDGWHDGRYGSIFDVAPGIARWHDGNSLSARTYKRKYYSDVGK
ncbi:hypothetical protein [uncultured Methylobacterium sp.]|jgi:hypothetical protein|uniref:HD domain-containing protein n=1 Tax=uncultured Methylobacterium sp. TaxID=157278 RepID=UPI00261E4335|nr:hypothetical protein [uncultured Methylobacterium sp.]